MLKQVEITSQNLEDNASIIQSMEQSNAASFSEIGENQHAGNSYLEEVDRQLVVEVKAKTQAEQDAENAMYAKKSEQEQFNHSKKVYNSLVKSRRNEKSLIKTSNASVLSVQNEVSMTTKANYIPEL